MKGYKRKEGWKAIVTVNCFWKVAKGWKPGKVDNDIKGFWKVAKGRKVERLGKKRLWLCDSDDGFWKVAKSCVWLTDVTKVSGGRQWNA